MSTLTLRPSAPTSGPPPNPRGRRHNAATMALARQMYGDGDAWTVGQIVEYLTRQGTPVSRGTVQLWLRPQRKRAYYDRRNERRRTRAEAAVSPHPILDRIRALRVEDVSYSAISGVLRVDGVANLSEEIVRYAFLNAREPLVDGEGEPLRRDTGRVRYAPQCELPTTVGES